MHIREATEADISSIVQLLKISLGEARMPKSEAFWRWKHINNPFGKSPVLLAFEDDLLIGVRAFMRWEWKQGNRIYKAVRAVDTATHPAYQGKGVFRELTLQLIEQCRAEGVHFIFNTPNKQSMPGYLKMGWQKHSRVSVNVMPLLFGSVNSDTETEQYRGANLDYSLSEAISIDIKTSLSQEFLRWRYAENPNLEYYQVQGETGCGIFRIKMNSKVREMRITHFFWNGMNSRDLRKNIISSARHFGVHMITWSGFQLPLPSISLPIGPHLIINSLNIDNSLSFDRWRPTLGDMEVF